MLDAQWPGRSRRVAGDGGTAIGSIARASGGLEAAGPLESDSGAYALVADARLDNREDLLERLGLFPAGDGAPDDIGLMMQCLERWGSEAIDGFVGDFALALWDRRRERLLLARDFAGQRPLHFHQSGRAIAVASMASGLHALDFVPRAANRRRMLETLASVTHEGRSTYFDAIERVEPGEVLTLRRGGHSSRTFWAPPREPLRLASHGEYAEALLETLDRAVAARLRGAGGTVGAHLSAGLDSSAVATSAALRFPGRVLAFTSVPPERLPPLPPGRFGDEGALAAETARFHPNIEHRLVATGERLPLEDLGWELPLFERPDLNLPNLAWATRINDAAAAEGVEVLLTGTMGNATISFGGFELLGDLLAEGDVGAFASEFAAALRAGAGARSLLGQTARRILPAAVAARLERLRGRHHLHPALVGVLNPRAAGIEDVVARFDRYTTRPFPNSVALRMDMIRRVDQGSFNKGTLLRWGIELSDPTADRRLVEFCLATPTRHYLHRGTPRALIRTALKGRIGEAARNDTQRGLQSPHWFSMLSEARDEAARLLARIEQCPPAHDLLDLDKMRRLLEQWPDPRGSYGPPVYRYGFLRGLSAGEFLRLHSSPPGTTN